MAHLSVWRCDTIVAGHRNLEAAPERCAVYRDYNGLTRVLNFEKQWKQASAALGFSGRHLLEFFDIRAGNERSPASNQNGGCHAGIFSDLIDCVANAFRHTWA